MDRFDVVIVGGGVAGCVLAARLSESGEKSVLLLESGDDLRPGRVPDALAGMNHLAAHAVPDRWNRTINEGPEPYLTGRGIGGGSAVNGMVMMWGSVADYDSWHEVHRADGWSAKARQVAMERVQATVAPVLTGRSRWGAVSRALVTGAKAVGVRAVGDHNTGEAGAASLHLGVRDGRRHLFVESYLEPARARANLTVGTDARVSRVLLDARRAVGVALDDGTSVASDDVVLCAGALVDPVILRNSEIVRRGIGENLHDHPVVSIPIALESAARSVAPDALVMGSAVRASLLEPLDTLLLPLDHLGQPVGTRDHGAVMIVLLSSRSRGRVELDGRLTRSLFTDQFDRDLLVRAADFARGVLGEGFSALGSVDASMLDQTPDALVQWARSHPANVFHAGGTCRMGSATDEDAVTDGRGAVIGYEGLWIGDASLMPEPVHAAPMATVAMLAEHVAECVSAAT